MGSEIDITSSFWKRYFSSEEDARKIDIFDLINASITVASFKKPNDEFRSRRLQIIDSLFATDSQAKRKAEVSERCRSGTKIEADKKIKVEEKSEKRVVDFNDLKFEASKRRFVEKNEEIEKSKKKVQILDVKDIVPLPPPPKLGRNGKPKRGFGSRMKKIQKKL
ncbi:uncharacterized protein Fot_15337 [Forsythia ovata]|uniref:Uncharacterized protein n=1 Tax=Forsythia ovata TaxID=205694 RepID=A0ABD1W8V8_9LAMI